MFILISLCWFRDVVDRYSLAAGASALVVKKALNFTILLLILYEFVLVIGFLFLSVSSSVDWFLFAVISSFFFVAQVYLLLATFVLFCYIAFVVYYGKGIMWNSGLEYLGFFLWRYGLVVHFICNCASALFSYYAVGGGTGIPEVSLVCELDPRLHAI